MKIETKYDLGQEVYYVRDEYTVEKGEVVTIYFDGTFKNIPKYEIEYNGNVFCEDDVFLTEEEAKQKAQSYISRWRTIQRIAVERYGLNRDKERSENRGD